MKTAKKPVLVQFTAAEKKALKALCIHRQTSQAGLIRKLIKEECRKSSAAVERISAVLPG